MRFTKGMGDHISPPLITAMAPLKKTKSFRFTGQWVFPRDMDAVRADKISIPFTVSEFTFQGIIGWAGLWDL